MKNLEFAEKQNITTIYSLYYREFNKDDKMINKVKEFKSDDARAKFIEKLIEKGKLAEIVSFSES